MLGGLLGEHGPQHPDGLLVEGDPRRQKIGGRDVAVGLRDFDDLAQAPRHVFMVFASRSSI
jgi:hypothetical protein